ncbi:hypothetical protein QYF36_004611 [Acer negundo]|nr:hypothetical protein QYF36_004611 [Acer negundo]
MTWKDVVDGRNQGKDNKGLSQKKKSVSMTWKDETDRTETVKFQKGEKVDNGHISPTVRTANRVVGGKYHHFLGEEGPREIIHKTNLDKGKDKLVLAQISKNKQQVKAKGYGFIILDKRNVGAVLGESSNSDSLTSSDQGVYRGESSKKDSVSHSLVGCNKERGGLKSLVANPLEDEQSSYDKGGSEQSKNNSEDGEIYIRWQREPIIGGGNKGEGKKDRESDIEVVDATGNQLSWCLEEEITKVIETGVALEGIQTRVLKNGKDMTKDQNDTELPW